MKQRHRKHRRPVREWLGVGWRDPLFSNVILLAPSKFDEIVRSEPGEVSPNLLRGEIGRLDCEFRILPLVAAQVHSVVVSETIEGLGVDPEPKPA